MVPDHPPPAWRQPGAAGTRLVQVPRRVCACALAAAEAATYGLVAQGVAFSLGVGLHVGRFQFGNIGSLQRMDFSAIGNEVNVAARIEAQCKVHGESLLMSADFARLCGADEYSLRAPLAMD